MLSKHVSSSQDMHCKTSGTSNRVHPQEIHLKLPRDFAPATFLCTFSIQAAVQVLQHPARPLLSSKCHCITHSHTTSRMNYTVNPFGTPPPKFEEQPYTKHYQAHVCLHVVMKCTFTLLSNQSANKTMHTNSRHKNSCLPVAATP